MIIGDVSELFLPYPIYLVATLILLCIAAFQSVRTSFMYRWRAAFVVFALWSWLLSTPALGSLLLEHLEGAPLAAPVVSQSDLGAVIVLSSGQVWASNGIRLVRMDENGWERLYQGIRLWRQTGGRLIFAGGLAGDRGDSMARLMSRVAGEFGVPNEALLTAAAATNTYEELLAAKELLADRSGPVWLVTSAAHMPRAIAVTRRLGMRVIPYPVDFWQLESPSWRAWIPNNGGSWYYGVAIHELVGLFVYRLRGWAD